MLWLIAVMFAQAAATPSPVEQPLPFSHRLHAERGLRCAFCHRMSGAGEVAGIPKAADCMSCHAGIGRESVALRALAEYAAAAEPIPWQRVYRLPSFVFFSHRKHADAGARCERCHGAVADRDTLAKEGDISMKA